MKRIIISPPALLDLDEIWFYIAEDSINAADHVIGELQNKLLLLAAQPLIGRERPEIATGVRSFPVGTYVLFYRAVTEAVEIARILHGSRDIENIV